MQPNVRTCCCLLVLMIFAVTCAFLIADKNHAYSILHTHMRLPKYVLARTCSPMATVKGRNGSMFLIAFC